MTPEQINIAIAERMGWKWFSSGAFTDLLPEPPANSFWVKSERPEDLSDKLHIPLNVLPNFHGSMNAAMKLVEFVKETGKGFSLTRHENYWQATFWYNAGWDSAAREYIGMCKSPSAAICEAFLKLPAT